MGSISKFAYAAVLSLSIFAVQPTLAAAADAHGSFTLTHEVHWERFVLTPGDYMFSVRNMGPSQFLVVRGINGNRTNLMLMATDVSTAEPSAGSRLELISREGKSFVSEMSLPAYELKLRFDVPEKGGSK